jgi:DNA-3-methyladenine glycosylase I
MGNPLYEHYHDTEWGYPCFNDRVLFEFLILESAQAGLSWITILKKREHYREAFAHFNPAKVAAFDQQTISELLQNSGIIRNKMKIESTINNARCYLELQQKFNSFADYLWNFVDGTPIQNQWNNERQIPAYTDLSDSISKEMKKRGFRFFGKTICYAYMQAIGMVNDHTLQCFRHRECLESR